MPRYFFDLQDDAALHLDDEGTELEDTSTARTEAIHALAEFARDALPGGDSKHLHMTVRDAAGITQFELDLVFRLNRVG